MKLPKSLDINTLMSKAVPGDMTVGELIKFTESSDAFVAIRKISSRPQAVRLRILDKDGHPVPDTMLMKDFRIGVKNNSIHIVIDDGEGGMRVDA